MARKPEGERPLTAAERQARHREQIVRHFSQLAIAINEALLVLGSAQKQFGNYTEHHEAKGDARKAAINRGFADACGKAEERLIHASAKCFTT